MRTDTGQTEGRTHVRRAMTKLVVTFRRFAIAQKKAYAGTDVHNEWQMKDCQQKWYPHPQKGEKEEVQGKANIKDQKSR